MKRTTLLLASFLGIFGALSLASARPAVGQTSRVLPLTIFKDGALTNAHFEQLLGKIVIAYYYTPW